MSVGECPASLQGKQSELQKMQQCKSIAMRESFAYGRILPDCISTGDLPMHRVGNGSTAAVKGFGMPSKQACDVCLALAVLDAAGRDRQPTQLRVFFSLSLDTFAFPQHQALFAVPCTGFENICQHRPSYPRTAVSSSSPFCAFWMVTVRKRRTHASLGSASCSMNKL